MAFLMMLLGFANVQAAEAFFLQDPITVTGTITDPTGMPLPGANVQEKGTDNGVVTDFDGYFSLEVASAESILQISYVGMATQEVGVTDGEPIAVQLEAEAESLEEVVLVGYGTQQRRSVTTAVAKVEAEEFNQGVVTSPLDLVQGKVAGLNITRAAGNNPNSSASIQLRGVTSLTGSTSPLIVIDGIPGGNLDLIQQNDIESFDVLKDGSAAAIYGTRGTNGVILITTKKGKKGVTSFEYSTYLSKEYVASEPNFLSADEYRGAIADGLIADSYDLGYSTDIFDELVNHSNLSQYHNFVASGGGENGTYRASLYYQELEGIAKENDRQEYGFRASFNQSGLDDKLTFQSSLSTNFSNANFLGGGPDDDNRGGLFGIVTDWNPTAPIYAPYSVEEGTDLYNEGEYGYYQPQNGFNPISQFANRTDERKQQTFSGDAKLTYSIIEGLDASIFGSYQRDTYNDRYYRSTQDWDQYNSGSAYNRTAYAYKGNYLSSTVTMEPTINYSVDIKDHSFELLGGYSYQYSTTETYSMDNSGFTSDVFQDWNFGAGNAITDTDLPRPSLGSFKEDNTLIAYFTRINYAFLDRYFFQASIRHEGSSRFGANNKWASFPAVSLGWLISDENFLIDSNWVNNLKLRVGYGETGNQGIPNYQSLYTLGTGGKYPIFLSNEDAATYYQTYGPNRNFNPNLKWETKKEVNFGLDFGLFQNRVSGALDVYYRKTEDLLLNYTVPQPPFVQPSIYTNVGSISNSGIELSLGVDILREGDFTWSADFAGNYQSNKLETLSNQTFIASELYGGNIGNPGNLGNAIRNTEGGPIGDFYGKHFAGFTDDGKWLFYKADGSTGTVDQMTEEDKTVIGNGVPKFNASLSNTFKYKNFDLRVFFRGKFDYDILNTVNLFYSNPTLLPGNVLSSALTTQVNQAPQFSDYYLEKGDFVKLDNITLGYSFDFKENTPIKALRIYVSARNLATFTGYSGRDPEVQDTGLYPGIDDRTFYPRTTTATAGFNVTF
ncbi:MAG: SusC/RagA family TonB-linked outer membrane protein [Cytophagaceae bacterium]|nr:SusC/RagA family TonB-linked outer membrane protein [Cytophagaceae bacterium]